MSQVLAMAHKIEELEKALALAKETNQQQQHFENRATSEQRYLTNQSQQHDTQEEQANGLRQPDYASPIYPSTSALQEPTTNSEMAMTPHVTPPASALPSMGEHQLDFWTTSMLNAAAMQLHISVDKIEHLFQTHWTWVHPCFLFVSRPAFLRDAATGGEHFSQLLLNVICLHSTRFTEHGLARDLQARVRLLLGQELHKEPTVPTVQALLQLSAKTIGAGEISQTWLYSGMAFRMAVHMGIFVRPNTIVDALGQGVREQLAWSCYLWDKAVSLYLGRAPFLSDAPSFEPPRLDEASEYAIWTPYFGDHGANTQESAPKSHTMSCFYHLCRLSVIVNEILVTVYTKNSNADPLPFVKDARQKLEHWRANTPANLLVPPDATVCPPPHLLHVNLLYYAATILLHRPFRASKTCRSICRSAADSVAHLLLLLERSLGMSHATYMIAYCAYTAATVGVLDMADGIEGSQQRVNTYLRALYGARYSCPGIQRSIDIIIGGFDKTSRREQEVRGRSDETEPFSSTQTEYPVEPQILPAFVSDQQQHFPGYDWTGDAGSTSTVPLGGLDPFAMEWSQLPMDAFDEFFIQQDPSAAF